MFNSLFSSPKWIFFLYFIILTVDVSMATKLCASFSQNGIKGDVEFQYSRVFIEVNGSEPEEQVELNIKVNLQTLMDTESGSYNWAVYELPVEYTKPIACDKGYVGERVLDLTALLGPVILPVNETMEFKTHLINLTGSNSLWGRTLVFEASRTLCATIMPVEGVKMAVANLPSPAAGSVTVMSWSVEDQVDVRIVTDLHHVSGDGTASNHIWKLYVTDVLDTKADRDRGDCNALQFLYDPDIRSGEGCSSQQPENCKMGDLSGRLGFVRVASRAGGGFGGGSRRVFRDPSLVLPDLKGPRHLYMVLFDKEIPDKVLSCGRFRQLQLREARATFSHKGVRGEILFDQRSPFDPTRVLVNLTGLSGMAGGFHVHEYPVPIARTPGEPVCSATANHYNPWGWNPPSSPPPGRGTGDVYELGDLSGKFGMLTGLNNLESDVTDTTLPLFGPYSITHRGLVIHLASNGSRWVCSNIEMVGVKMLTAVAIFRYPLGGRIMFRQAAEDPFSETMVYVESLIYSDGSLNETLNHQLEIHNSLPDEDYHDWQQRCKSAGDLFNPFKVSNRSRNDCGPDTQRRCPVGDLTAKHGRLSIAGGANQVKMTQKLFTDTNLPLSGPQSVVGRSLVILDDNSPKQRGNRLACTPITYYHRHKAVVRDWFGNGLSTSLEGKVEFIQETEFASSAILTELTGLGGQAGKFGVYSAPVRGDLQFPCTEQAIGVPLNPLRVNTSIDLSNSGGTPDQFAIGDLSSKFGQLSGFTEVNAVFNDSNLPLYGSTSIIGRSFVLNRATDNERWTCGTLGWGFSPSEAVEVRAIASFHHPGGFAWGYVRLSQVVYHDGSATETLVEVSLKHPGKQNGRATRNHRWAVYVNPVGQDAAVESTNVRCVAAGFTWNPAFVQLVDPRNEENYQRECQPHVPYRCMIGDLSGRLGNIDIGLSRYVFSDRNLPLYGKFSVLGRSIVILSPEGGPNRFACANILEDKDIFKFVVVRKPPRFVASEFVEDVRRVLGVPEWMLAVDSRQTREVQNGRCVQFKMHFYGPYAPRIEQDLGLLLAKGRVDVPSIEVPGAHLDPNRKKSLPYRVCTERDNAEFHSSGVTFRPTTGVPTLILLAIILLFRP